MTADQTSDRERIARALNVAGWTCNGGYHEPEQYDECAECRAVCGGMADAALAALDLPARDNAVARKAWDDGARAMEQLYKRTVIGLPQQPAVDAPSSPYPTPKENPDGR